MRDFFLIAPYIYYKYAVADEKRAIVALGKDYTPLYKENNMPFGLVFSQ